MFSAETLRRKVVALNGKGKVVFLSTYPPRECGIATFTKDLSDSLQKRFGNAVEPAIVAMEEGESSFRIYNRKVVSKINEESAESYKAAARKINSMPSAAVVNIQHEYGIFGGIWGENLISFMELTEKKVVTTFHTVLENPGKDLLRVTKRICALSSKLVVMTENAKKILVKDYGVPPKKIAVIPHGVPNIDVGREKQKLRKKFGLEGVKVLLTFGMLSRGKALEHAVAAMPKILERHPDAVYLIVGETHPKVREHEGESYRLELRRLAESLGISEKVKFLDKYLSLKEIIECLKIADVYIAPSLDPKQICSGTVSYAMSAGKAIVSSQNKYNEEMLSHSRGLIVGKNDASEFAVNVIRLLDDAALKRSLERNSFEYSRRMTWQNVSTSYFQVFSGLSPMHSERFSRVPRLNFRHFYGLTDDFGMMQFADYNVPLRESGYTLDDNSRALTVAVKAYSRLPSKKMLKAAGTFISFVEKCQISDGYFRNFVDGNREFADEAGSEDSFGRTVKALGGALKSPLPEDLKLRARNVLEKALRYENEIVSPRAQANTLIGLSNASGIAESFKSLTQRLLESLVSKFEANKEDDWHWFEPYLTYSNSVLPEALFEAEKFDKTRKARKIAVASLDFLTKTHFINGKLVPVGQDGWFRKNGRRAFYDQQPIEASTLTTTYLKAFNATNDSSYLSNARKSFEWFLGRNTMNQMVYDESTGGCFDGITRNGVNLNQGAESTISYLNARLSIV